MSNVCTDIHLGVRKAIRRDGTVGDVVRLLDDAGEPTELIAESRVAIVAWPDGLFEQTDLAAFDFTQRSN